MTTLYEEIFEGKKPKSCEDCVHFDICEHDSQMAGIEMNAETCDIYDKDGVSLYDELFGEQI